MEQLFIPILVGLTSIVAYLLGTRWLGLSGDRVGAAFGGMLVYVGVTVVFFVVNLSVGVLIILAIRLLMGGFVSLYLTGDIALLGLSLLQGLTFTCWRELSAPPRR